MVNYSYNPIIGEYDYIFGFQEGLALVRNNYKEKKAGFINKIGQLYIPLNYYCSYKNTVGDQIFLNFPYFNDGLAIMISKNGGFGFIDKMENVVIPFIYDDAYIYQNGLAAVKKDNKWGFINKNNEIIIPIEYNSIGTGIFNEGLLAVNKGNMWGFINEFGETVIPFEYNIARGCGWSFSEGVSAVEKNGKKGYIDKKNNTVISIELEYDYIGNFHEGFASVSFDSKYGLINKLGEIVVPIKYTSIRTIKEGFALLEKEGGYDIINKKGVHVFSLSCEKFGDFHEGLAVIKKDGNHYFIDKTGEIQIDLKDFFDDVNFYKNGYARVKKDNKWGYIDRYGKVVIPIKYKYAGIFNEGLSIVNDGKWGILELID